LAVLLITCDIYCQLFDYLLSFFVICHRFFNHNRPTAYLIPAETYEQLMEKLEDFQLGFIVKERQHEKISAVEVSLDEL
jgi:antitoxin StbD